MEQKEKIKYQRNCLLGALGAALLIVGDLCISIVPASPADKGLYVRGAYLNGDFQLWRVALLLVTGLVGMFFYAFGIDAISEQILPKYRKTRALVQIRRAHVCRVRRDTAFSRGNTRLLGNLSV